jgi:dihydroorotate dehydrogenase
MYKSLVRPLLFRIDPEKVHHFVVGAVKLLDKVPGITPAMMHYTSFRDPSGGVVIGGLHFPGRVGLAAGFDKNAEFYNEFAMFGFSFIEIGTVTPLPQPGNSKPRLFRLKQDQALINRMGFNNKGVEEAVKRLKGRYKRVIIGGNIGKNTLTPNENAAQDYAACFDALFDHVDYFTINVSCPNIAGMEKLQDHNSLRAIVDAVMTERRKKSAYKPVFLKISPDLTFSQIDEVISMYAEVGLDGIIATNTTTDRNCLSSPAEMVSIYGPGGLSGKPLFKRSLEIISYICKQSSGSIPVIGVGGIMNEDDAIDMIRAGARLLQIYTGFIYEGPFIVRKINKALKEFLQPFPATACGIHSTS